MASILIIEDQEPLRNLYSEVDPISWTGGRLN